MRINSLILVRTNITHKSWVLFLNPERGAALKLRIGVFHGIEVALVRVNVEFIPVVASCLIESFLSVCTIEELLLFRMVSAI